MFNIAEFQESTTWDLKNKIFYTYCNWCFANRLDNNGKDCDECQSIFWEAIKRREEKGIL